MLSYDSFEFCCGPCKVYSRPRIVSRLSVAKSLDGYWATASIADILLTSRFSDVYAATSLLQTALTQTQARIMECVTKSGFINFDSEDYWDSVEEVVDLAYVGAPRSSRVQKKKNWRGRTDLKDFQRRGWHGMYIMAVLLEVAPYTAIAAIPLLHSTSRLLNDQR